MTREFRHWPHPAVIPLVQPLVEAVAATVERELTGPRRRRWSWPASSPVTR